MFDDVLNRKEGFCILENVILTVLKTCILPMELTMILLKIMKFLFSLVIYWKKLKDAFLAGRWPTQMIWRENRIREAMGRKSRRSNQETNPNQVTKRKQRSEQLKPEVRKIGWYIPLLINKMAWLREKTSSTSEHNNDRGFNREAPLKHNVATTEGKLSNNIVCSSFSGVACVAQWVSSLSLI